jgi:hypothetical protein
MMEAPVAMVAASCASATSTSFGLGKAVIFVLLSGRMKIIVCITVNRVGGFLIDYWRGRIRCSEFHLQICDEWEANFVIISPVNGVVICLFIRKSVELQDTEK